MAASKPTTFKPNQLVTLKMETTSGTWYTVWAPLWVVRGEKWQAFLGKDDTISVFSSPAELHAHVVGSNDHVLSEHPKWQEFKADADAQMSAQKIQEISLIETPNQLADRASYENVRDVGRAYRLLQSIGGVAGIESINKWFGSYSMLQNVYRGADHYSGQNGVEEWTAMGRIVLGAWAEMLDDLEDGLTEVDVAEDAVAESQKRIDAVEKAAADASAAAAKKREDAAAEKAAAGNADDESTDPYDKTVWAQAGIDPIRISLNGQRVYTLRCYVGGKPVFLGRHGQINTFPYPRSLVRWLIDAPQHDLEEMETWGEIVQAANAGELEVTVHDLNQYTFTGLREDIAKSVDAVDPKQLSRAYELLADAADWAGDDAVNKVLVGFPRLQTYISYVTGSPSGTTPTAPFDEEVRGWKQLEEDLIKRFSKF